MILKLFRPYWATSGIYAQSFTRKIGTFRFHSMGLPISFTVALHIDRHFKTAYKLNFRGKSIALVCYAYVSNFATNAMNKSVIHMIAMHVFHK